MEKEVLSAEIVIIGGGAAGCFAALKAREMEPELDILILEKAQINRSGCLAKGINALNAYLTPGETPKSYLEYVKNDSRGLVRDDLVYTIGQRLNEVTRTVDQWGLSILKDENGNYQARSRRSIKIKGENFKPLLASRVKEANIKVKNRTVVTNYLVSDEKIKGCFAFDLQKNVFYTIKAGVVICATGGAAGLYLPNNTGQASHKLWYSPFNTGAGYAMGVRAGVELTTLEMRFVALRIKDVMAPTGTFAFAGAQQINDRGEEYLTDYGENFTSQRLFATVQEEKKGKGPCFLDLTKISEKKARQVYNSMLDMAPDLVLKWAEEGIGPEEIKVVIEGTDPYIVGGHCGAGYWVDKNRQTTLANLYAIGDVAGGAPKKYVTGAFAEAKIAVQNIINRKKNSQLNLESDFKLTKQLKKRIEQEYKRVVCPLQRQTGCQPDQLEINLQQVMDKYAGGKSQFYELEGEKLQRAEKLLKKLKKRTKELWAEDTHELMLAHEVIDRIDIAQVLVKHLLYRRETRWPGYQTRIDYPDKKPAWKKFINSRYNKNSGQIEIIEHPYHSLEGYRDNEVVD